MAVKHPVLEGLKPVPGTIRLVVFRWLLWILSGLPGVVLAGGLLEDAARRPFFAEAPDPLPVAVLGNWLAQVPGGLWGALVAGAAGAWLVSLLLTVAAVEVLDPRRRATPFRVWRIAFDQGVRYLASYLRVALVALIVILVGSGLVNALFDALADAGVRSRWTGRSLLLTLGFWRSAALLSWLTVVGAAATWGRVVLVADERRFVRRLPLLVLRLWLRQPIAALAFPLVAMLGSLVVGGLVLFGWRQSPGTGAGWAALWLVVLLLQSWLWHWRLRVARIVWSDPAHEDLRRTADAPWSWLRRRIHGLREQQGLTPPGGRDAVPLGGAPPDGT